MANKVSVIIRKAFKEIGDNSKHGSCQIKMYTANTGQIFPVGTALEATRTGVYSAPVAAHKLVGIKKPSHKPTGKLILSKEQAMDYADAMDELHTGSDHLNIKSDPIWRKLYLFRNRPLAFEATDGGGQITRILSSVPCHHCGIIMPEDAIQVDHYMPQAQSPDLYTIKTLRALGLTVGKGTGYKGYNFDNSVKNFGLTFKIYPTGRERGNMAHLLNGTSSNKWTTNSRGNALLSLVAYAEEMPSFKRLCKNSLLNLMPLCSHCNQRKSNQIRPIR